MLRLLFRSWGILLVLWPCSAPGQLVINEFLADPEGSDSGQEYVEFYNAGAETLSLTGVKFQFANGAVGAQWDTRWQADPGLSLAPGAFFLLVDRNWQGFAEYQAMAYLGLQNGPDAIRLLRDEEVLDLVGYGSLTDPELLEGMAVPLVSGLALARRPDGQDTDNNSLDFVSTEPTPGENNFLDLDLRIDSVILDPPSLTQAGGSLQVSVVVGNEGIRAFPACDLQVLSGPAGGVVQVVAETFFSGCPTGETVSLHLLFELPDQGRQILQLHWLADQGSSPLTRELSGFQVGPAELILNEVLAAPSNAQGEWVELLFRQPVADLSLFSLRDEEGGWHSLPAMSCEAGQLVVVAQDSTALIQWHQMNLDQGLILDCPAEDLARNLRQFPGSWPSLNNNPPQDRSYADRVYLADAQAVVMDHVTLPGSDALPDVDNLTWEWTGSQWRPAVCLAGGTPGCGNSVAVSSNHFGPLEMVPAVLDPSQGVVAAHIRFQMPDLSEGWHVEIYDLWGQRVRDLGGQNQTAGAVDLVWDGLDDQGLTVRPGGYIVLQHLKVGAGPFKPGARTLVVVR